MRIDALWTAMESETPATTNSDWLLRLALPQPGQALLVALEISTRQRALLLPLTRAAVPARRLWPDCRGLEVFGVVLGEQAHLGVRLRDPACGDVFTALAEDVALRVAAAPDERTAAAALLNRLHRWQKFLAAGAGGLSPERQRGLYGELRVLHSHLITGLGAAAAVDGWRAPRATHQDFQFASGAVEVKTTTALQPQTVRIASERQLDDTGIPALFLLVVVLDEREVEGEATNMSDTLPGVVALLRQDLAHDEGAAMVFEDRLLESGYLEADSPRYESRRLTVRDEHIYRVVTGFPRLIETSLPPGIGDVGYALSLASAAPFAVPAADMTRVLKGIV